MKTAGLKKHFGLIKALSRVAAEDRESILQHLEPPAVDILSECVHNCITGVGRRLPAEARLKLKKSISKDASVLRLLSKKSKRRSEARQRKLLCQSGGSLGLILATILPIISSLLFNK